MMEFKRCIECARMFVAPAGSQLTCDSCLTAEGSRKRAEQSKVAKKRTTPRG